MTPLPQPFVDIPIAHRAYHDGAAGRPENSLAAIRAAIAAGYPIEIDLQLSADGQAVVFHDYHLDRMTPEKGPVRLCTASELGRIPLNGSDERIPMLRDVLSLVAGRVPLLVEIKDQDGAMGPDVGALEQATTDALAGYDGPVAVMSFNPHSAALLAHHLPDRAVGLTTCAFEADDWPLLPPGVRTRLAGLPDAEHLAFISHLARDLGNPRVAELKAGGMPILCWTVSSPEAEARARRVADNITFEGYPAARPGA